MIFYSSYGLDKDKLKIFGKGNNIFLEGLQIIKEQVLSYLKASPYISSLMKNLTQDIALQLEYNTAQKVRTRLDIFSRFISNHEFYKK